VSLQQIVVTVVLILLLGGLAGYFAWRQIQTLRNVARNDNLTAEDRRYFRRQAWRRLIGCLLMAGLLGLMGGSFFLEDRAERLGTELKDARDRGEQREPDPEQRQFMRFYGGYWIVILLFVSGLVGIAFVDLVSIRRYGQRHYRKLQADRRAMIERQVLRLRQERNGHN
jgi:hypothetical protein